MLRTITKKVSKVFQRDHVKQHDAFLEFRSDWPLPVVKENEPNYNISRSQPSSLEPSWNNSAIGTHSTQTTAPTPSLQRQAIPPAIAVVRNISGLYPPPLGTSALSPQTQANTPRTAELRQPPSQPSQQLVVVQNDAPVTPSFPRQSAPVASAENPLEAQHDDDLTTWAALGSQWLERHPTRRYRGGAQSAVRRTQVDPRVLPDAE